MKQAGIYARRREKRRFRWNWQDKIASSFFQRGAHLVARDRWEKKGGGREEKRRVKKERERERERKERGESRADVSISFDPPFDRKARRGQSYDSAQLHTVFRTSISFVHTYVQTYTHTQSLTTHAHQHRSAITSREPTTLHIHIYI